MPSEQVEDVEEGSPPCEERGVWQTPCASGSAPPRELWEKARATFPLPLSWLRGAHKQDAGPRNGQPPPPRFQKVSTLSGGGEQDEAPGV